MEEYIIESSGALIYIGIDIPDEYTLSNYTMLLRGVNTMLQVRFMGHIMWV